MSTITIDPAHPWDVFVQVTGRFEKDNVRQQGVIRLESQGEDIYFTYIPHFNPAVTVLSNDVGSFTERELTSACSFTMKPAGDGFAGETLGITACALAMRGAIGKWSVELEPGGIRLQSVKTGETRVVVMEGSFVSWRVPAWSRGATSGCRSLLASVIGRAFAVRIDGRCTRVGLRGFRYARTRRNVE